MQRALYDTVCARMAEAYRGLTVGPAMADLRVGPLISARQKGIVERYLSMADPAHVQSPAAKWAAQPMPEGGH